MTQGVSIAESHRIARAVVQMAQVGHFGGIVELFGPPLAAVVSVKALKDAWAAETAKIGGISFVGEPASDPTTAGLVRVSVPLTGERGTLTVVVSVDDKGVVQGLRLDPAARGSWTTPPYAAPTRFEEHDVALGTGALVVQGTLSMPRGPATVPGVVLLSGGGPFDRDETAGSNKPLKDLAWGLASRDIAVARFDKVSHTHADYVARTPEFTMTDDYVPHAVAAVRLLQAAPRVDPDRVFVLGHSMGGKVAPRVAQAEPSVAGLVIMAGDTQPMHHAAVRVARYLAALDPPFIDAAGVEMITRQAARVESPDLSSSTAANELPFGFSGAYWLDVRGYDPVATAASLDKPMLIVQGGRDYQVTVDGDLAGWRAGLAHRRDVTLRVYSADDHLFFPGSGPSAPADYEAPQHVDPDVIEDIAAWIKSRV
ncbi:MAG: alpha/beta hydrolase [Gemmatimonadales bacterium]